MFSRWRSEQGRTTEKQSNTLSFAKITDIKHLLTKESGSFFTMGMLTRLQDGLYHLEDPHAEIGLEFQTGVGGDLIPHYRTPFLIGWQTLDVGFPNSGSLYRKLHGRC